MKIRGENLLNFEGRRGGKECKPCRSRRMLQDEPTLAIVAVVQPRTRRQLDNRLDAATLVTGASAASASAASASAASA